MIILSIESIIVPTSTATWAPASHCMCTPPLSSVRLAGEQIGCETARVLDPMMRRLKPLVLLGNLTRLFARTRAGLFKIWGWGQQGLRRFLSCFLGLNPGFGETGGCDPNSLLAIEQCAWYDTFSMRR